MLRGNFFVRFAGPFIALGMVVLAILIGRAEAQTYTPSVATNADLEAASTSTYPNGLWRLDWEKTLGAPPVYYLPSATTPNTKPCTAPDNGAQVPSADGNCWYAHFSSSAFDVRDWGAVPDFNGSTATDNAAAINSTIAYAL